MQQLWQHCKPIEYHEGQKAQIMAAVGTYKGKTSTALGVAHYANPDLLIHAGAAYGVTIA